LPTTPIKTCHALYGVSGPEGPVWSHVEILDPVAGQTILGAIRLNPHSIETEQAGLRAEPDESLAVLRDGIDGRTADTEVLAEVLKGVARMVGYAQVGSAEGPRPDHQGEEREDTPAEWLWRKQRKLP